MTGRIHIITTLLCLSTSLMAGCGDEKTKRTVKAKQACQLSLDTLGGTEWAYLVANQRDINDTPDPVRGRLQFSDEGGKVTAKYNAASKGDMYDYECAMKGESLACKTQPEPDDWCRAFLAGGKTCDVAALQALDSRLSAEDAAKGVEAGTKEFNEAKKTKKGIAWKRFLQANNSLGNKLQGRLYISVNKRRKNCNLRVSDMVMHIYNGISIEDAAPNGANTFVKIEEDLLWEHCEPGQRDLFVGRPEPGFPKNLKVGHLARYRVGDTVHFTYLGADGMEPPPGCSFSFDVYVEARPVAKGLVPGEAKIRHKGRMKPVAAWLWSKQFDKPSPAAGEIVAMVRYKECAGKREQMGVACAAVKAK